MVEVDHAADELRRENADAAIVEQVDAVRGAVLDEGRVVAEMRIAVDHAEAAERLPPSLKHRDRDAIARRDVIALVGQQLVALEPVEGEETPRRLRGPYPRHSHLRGR